MGGAAASVAGSRQSSAGNATAADDSGQRKRRKNAPAAASEQPPESIDDANNNAEDFDLISPELGATDKRAVNGVVRVINIAGLIINGFATCQPSSEFVRCYL